jgi:hypothetical protein
MAAIEGLNSLCWELSASRGGLFLWTRRVQVTCMQHETARDGDMEAIKRGGYWVTEVFQQLSYFSLACIRNWHISQIWSTQKGKLPGSHNEVRGHAATIAALCICCLEIVLFWQIKADKKYGPVLEVWWWLLINTRCNITKSKGGKSENIYHSSSNLGGNQKSSLGEIEIYSHVYTDI